MGAIKFLSNQFRVQMFSLNHDNLSDFYLSPWKSNKSLLPVLLFRIFLFLISVITLLLSIVLTREDVRSYWLIYMTNWGVCTQLVTTGFAVAVSAKFYFTKTTDTSLGLPWYVKTYWFLVNTTTAVAILITIYYYSLLYVPGQADNLLVDVMTHGINSVVVILLLLSSRTPSHLLHFYQPVIFNLLYTLFNITFYLSGGTNPDGEAWVYPTVNWSQPGPTSITTLITWIFFILIHVVVVLLAAARDAISRRFLRTEMQASSEDPIDIS